MTQKSQEELFSIAVLIDNLKHEEVTERLNSMRSLQRISAALGPKRTREELVPFLQECCDDDDEVLLALCNGLPGLVQQMGGEKQYAHLIFEPLRVLACSDSKVVRDAAVAQLKVHAEASGDATAQLLGITERLLESDWYNWRQSGLQLSGRYLKLTQDGEKRAKVITLIKQAAADQLPMVRRQVAESMAEIAVELQVGELMQMRTVYKQLTEDAQDAVRAVALKAAPQLLLQMARLQNVQPAAELMAARREIFQKFMQSGCTDISWRARYSCADVFSQVLEAYLGFQSLAPLFTAPRETRDSRECEEAVDPWLGNSPNSPSREAAGKRQTFNTEILADKPGFIAGQDYDEVRTVQTFAKLLSDAEAEVRCIAVQRCIRVSNRISQGNILQYVIPQLDERAAADDSPFVRVTLAKHLGAMAPMFQKEQIIRSLLPIMFKQLEDKDAEVRVTLLNGVQQVVQLVGIGAFGEKLQHSILVLSDEQDWRIRKQTLEAIPALAGFLTQAQFDEKLRALVGNYLNDSVNYVRRTCVQTLVQVAAIYGREWSNAKLVPLIQELCKKVSYLQRNNAIYLIETAGLTLGIQQELAPILIQLCGDPVPNIRFMAAEVLGHFGPALGSQKEQVKQVLQELTKDQDVDVKQFAQIALSKQ